MNDILLSYANLNRKLWKLFVTYMFRSIWNNNVINDLWIWNRNRLNIVSSIKYIYNNINYIGIDLILYSLLIW